jgi:hypothetical protein
MKAAAGGARKRGGRGGVREAGDEADVYGYYPASGLGGCVEAGWRSLGEGWNTTDVTSKHYSCKHRGTNEGRVGATFIVKTNFPFPGIGRCLPIEGRCRIPGNACTPRP